MKTMAIWRKKAGAVKKDSRMNGDKKRGIAKNVRNYNQVPKKVDTHKLPPYRQKALVRTVDKPISKKHIADNLIIPIKEYQNYPTGSTIRDKVPTDYKIQVWGVDETRNPSFHGAYDYYILATTTIPNIQQAQEILEPIVQRFGTVKLNTIYREDPEYTKQFIEDISDMDPTVLYQNYRKQDQDESSENYYSRQVMYTALYTTIQKIKRLSDADVILVLVDSNTFLEPEDYYSLSSDNIIVRMANDKWSTHVRMADIMAGIMDLYMRDYDRDTEPIEMMKKNIRGAKPYREPQSPYGLTTSLDNNYRSNNIKSSLKRLRLFRRRT